MPRRRRSFAGGELLIRDKDGVKRRMKVSARSFAAAPRPGLVWKVGPSGKKRWMKVPDIEQHRDAERGLVEVGGKLHRVWPAETGDLMPLGQTGGAQFVEIPDGYLPGRQVATHYNVKRKPVPMLSIREHGNTIGHGEDLRLSDVNFRVNQSGRLTALRTGQKNVHALMHGRVTDTLPHSLEELQERQRYGELVPVAYNPAKYTSFVRADTGAPIHEAAEIYASGRFRPLARVK